MMILDYLMMDNRNAAKDCTALLAVVGQMVLDNGRLEGKPFELARGHSNVGVHQQTTSGYKQGKEFCAFGGPKVGHVGPFISFLKEMDVIAAKRLEFPAHFWKWWRRCCPKTEACRGRGRGRGGLAGAPVEEA